MESFGRVLSAVVNRSQMPPLITFCQTKLRAGIVFYSSLEHKASQIKRFGGDLETEIIKLPIGCVLQVFLDFRVKVAQLCQIKKQCVIGIWYRFITSQ